MESMTKGRGWFDVECVNPDGSIAWLESFRNGTTTGGLTDRLNGYFNGGTARPNWYLFLVDNAGFAAFATGDTMAAHAGWAESVAYNEANRPAWTPLTVAAASVVNSAVGAFTINASVTIKGVGLCSDNTKGGVAGILWADGAFSSPQALVSGQVLNVTYRHTDA